LIFDLRLATGEPDFGLGIVQASTEFYMIPLIVLFENSPGLSAILWLIGPEFFYL
jgi:hypothetical protein